MVSVPHISVIVITTWKDWPVLKDKTHALQGQAIHLGFRIEAHSNCVIVSQTRLWDSGEEITADLPVVTFCLGDKERKSLRQGQGMTTLPMEETAGIDSTLLTGFRSVLPGQLFSCGCRSKSLA